MGLLDECVDHCLCVFARRPDQHHVTCVTFDKRRDLAVVAATDKITFPVTRYSAILPWSFACDGEIDASPVAS